MQHGLPGIPASAELYQLASHFDGAGFFDIETASEGGITLIACLQGKRLHMFLRGENLDDFLALLDDIPLLISFNGKSFDVPQVLRHFHVPQLPCDHLDLRYPCKAHGLTGGLKNIERALGIARPPDVHGLNGDDAMWLWRAWEHDKDASARRRAIRYCGADVIGLREIASHLLDQHLQAFAEPPPSLWHLLEDQSSKFQVPRSKSDEQLGTCNLEPGTGESSPLYQRLRAKARQMGQRVPSQPRAVQNWRP